MQNFQFNNTHQNKNTQYRQTEMPIQQLKKNGAMNYNGTKVPLINREPYYQMTTNNRSFLEMHYYLKAKNIQNNKFMLRLLDLDLAAVDPRDPNLSQIMKVKILREVQNNVWYFLREVVRVPAVGNPQGDMYKLTRGTLAMTVCVMYNLNIFLELPRQQGKSMSACIWYLYVYNFGSSNAEIAFLNKQMKDANANLKHLKDVRDLLPSYLQMAQDYTMSGNKKKRVSATVQSMEHSINRNIIRTHPSARNEIAAGSLLRGKTISMLWCDEWAFTPYNKTIYLSTVPALNTAFNTATKYGVPHGIIITTTPGFLTTKEAKFAFDMIRDSTEFDEGWYDLSYNQIMAIVSYNKLSTMVHIKYTYQQLGQTEEWFNKICIDMANNWRDIRREVLLEWSDAPENSPFQPEDLEAIGRMIKKEPLQTINIFDKFKLNIYERIPLNRNGIPKFVPIIGVDTSGGNYRDSSAITIIDSKTTRVIADLNNNSITQVDLARVVLYIVNNMLPNAVINIERNGGFGQAVVAWLKESSIKKNLYFEIKDKIIEETNDGYGIIHKKKRITKVYGLTTDKKIRDNLIEILKDRVRLHKDKIASKQIFEEIKGMEVKKNGKIEHSDNSHDDQVFSWLMALYVWYYGVNIRENFNIEKTSIKTDLDIDDTITDLDRNYTSIVDEIQYITDDSEVKDEVDKQLKELKEDTPILMKDFYANERHNEEEEFKMMLKNKAVMKAYLERINSNIPTAEDLGLPANAKNIPQKVTEEDIKSELGVDTAKISDSVFNNFNNGDYDYEERQLKERFNFNIFNNER